MEDTDDNYEDVEINYENREQTCQILEEGLIDVEHNSTSKISVFDNRDQHSLALSDDMEDQFG